MTHASLEERAAQADRVAAMAGMVERLLAGEATRPEVQAWAAAARRAGGPLAGNPVADDLDACLDALDVDQAGHPLLDDADLRDHLDALRRGAPACRHEVGKVARTARALAHALAVPCTRGRLAGVGWQEVTRFASPVTGRAFAAWSGLDRAGPPTATVYTTAVGADAAHAEVITDLLETLAIDLDDITGLRSPVELPRWHLRRVDDNAQTATIATYSGHAKARAALAVYEARGHKQLYWLERA